jgi:tetratricopeptide (TPR) repeat protein/transcriptional regulator with XRE-family HTH domain
MTKGEPNERLRKAREARGWSQDQLAAEIGVELRTITRWETGETTPSANFRRKLRQLFNMDEVALGFGRQAKKEPDIFNVPYRRNPYFTGHESTLKNLHDTLTTSNETRLPLAISGLGGIGKTQLVVEYAYQYSHLYQAVLWAGANSRAQLVSHIVVIADLLDLPEKDARNQSKVIHAVKRWLDLHTYWLLVLDEVDDLDMISEFLPSGSNGHIVLTTRTQLVGTRATRIDIEKMDAATGATLLLRCAKKISPTMLLDQASLLDQEQARELSREMDGLPLALDQAAAYITSEGRLNGVVAYLTLYRERRADLLKIRGTTGNDHPMSVTTTFSLSFDKISEFYPGAAALLQYCAFLSPESIPEELIMNAPDLGPDLQPVAADSIQFHNATEALLKYSLVSRVVDAQAFTMHRLVQAVLQDRMDEAKRRLWIDRVVKALDHAYEVARAGMVHGEDWYTIIQHTMRYDIHALECAEYIKQSKLEGMEVFFLLSAAGNSLRERGLYALAEPLLQQAITIGEKFVGQEQVLVANTITILAMLYEYVGKFDRAESLLKQALTSNERVLEPGHTIIAISLNNLGQFYTHVGNYIQAEQCYRRALNAPEGSLRPEHSDDPVILSNVALFYLQQGKYDLATQFNQRAQTLRKGEPGFTNTIGLPELSNLVLLEARQGKYDLAQSHCQQALAILDQAQIPEEHPIRALFLNHLAGIFMHQKKDAEAEKLYHSVLGMRKSMLGDVHPDVAGTLTDLAVLYKYQEKHEQAASCYKQALTILEETWGAEHIRIVETLVDLAELYRHQRKYHQARPLYEQALVTIKRTHSATDEHMAYTLIAYVSCLEEMGEQKEAQELAEFLKALNPAWIEAVQIKQRQAFERRERSPAEERDKQ